MNRNVVRYFVVLIVLFAIAFGITLACKEENKDKGETILTGTTTVLVDQTIASIIDEEKMVFESQYNAKINQINKPETEIVNDLIQQKANIAVLTRKLTEKEELAFTKKQIRVRVTPFGFDAVVFITNKASNDTLVELEEVINLMNNKTSSIKSLVFDNPNSSTTSHLCKLAGVSIIKNRNVYSLKNTAEVIKYISENQNAIGVIGLNEILSGTQNIDQFKVMAVRNVKSAPNHDAYYKPTQDILGKGLYPLRRQMYMLNYQGKDGLGIGFASFIAGEIGQKIILKSGLLPERISNREIITRKQIENNN